MHRAMIEEGVHDVLGLLLANSPAKIVLCHVRVVRMSAMSDASPLRFCDWQVHVITTFSQRHLSALLG